MPRLSPAPFVLFTALWVTAARPAETTRVIRRDVPERFLLSFDISGRGTVDVLLGEAVASLRVGGEASSANADAGPDTHITVPSETGLFELYGLATDSKTNAWLAYAFLDGRFARTLPVRKPKQNLSICAKGEPEVLRVRFTSLPDVFYRDDFMRSGEHAGDWRVTTSGLQVETAVRAEISSSPFRLLSTRSDRAEMRTGNRFWWDYHAACSARLPNRDGAKVLLGSHLRNQDGIWASLERRDGTLLFRVFHSVGGSRAELLLRKATEARPSWHEIALSSRAASFDGEVWPFQNRIALAGGEAAIAAEGEGVRIDDVRFESGHTSLPGFLDAFWRPPGAVQPVFKTKDDMAQWAKGRFLWNVDGARNAAAFRYPVHGEREIILGNLGSENGPQMKVNAAEGAVFTISGAEGGNILVQADAGDKSSTQLIPLSSRLSLAVRQDGLYAAGKRLLEADLSPRGSVGLERLGKTWPSELELRSPSLRDYTFSRAPAHFDPLSGSWDTTSRWRCFPAYNWFGGRGDPSHAVYRYRLEGEDSSVAVAFAPGMTARSGPFYNYPMGLLIALSPDPADPYAGAAVVWEVLTAPSKLFIAGSEKAQFRTYATDSHSPAGFQHGFSSTHRRWDIVRLFRHQSTLTVTINDNQAFRHQDPLLEKCRYLHLLAPSKSVAMVSRICVSAGSLTPAASEIGRSLQQSPPAPHAVSIRVGDDQCKLTAPPREGSWALFMGTAQPPDRTEAVPDGFRIVLERPALRWVSGIRLPKPAQLSGVSFQCQTSDLPRAALYLDTNFGPVAVPLGEGIPAGPYHIIPAAREGAACFVDLLKFEERAGACPLVSGVYWGELGRDEAGAFGFLSHKAGRSLLVTHLKLHTLNIEDASSAGARPHSVHMPPLSFARVKVLAADGSAEMTLPAPPLVRALNGDALAVRDVLGLKSTLGYSDGAGLFMHWGHEGLAAVNPRMGGPAGIWLHIEPFSKSACPLLYLEYENIDELPALPWSIVAAASNGKVALSLSDNQQHIPVVASPAHLSGKHNCLYDLQRVPGDIIHVLALADMPWYSSVEWAAIRIKRIELGLAVTTDDTIAFEGIENLKFAFLDTSQPDKRQFQGLAKDGRIPLRSLLPGRRYLLEVSDAATTRRIPIKIVKERAGPEMHDGDKIPPSTPVMTVLPRQGFLRTDFTSACPVSMLPANRRGTLPVVNPPWFWLEKQNRLASLGGGLFAEILGKGTEGYHVLHQDSDLPDGMLLRLMYAAKADSAPTVMLFGRQYSTFRQVGLKGTGTAEWQWHETPLPSGTDAVALNGRRLLALRAVSIAPPTERRFTATLHHGGDRDIFTVRVRSKSGKAILENRLEPGQAHAPFELPAPGAYVVTGLLEDASGRETTLNSLGLTVK